ncbi:unnamed protein product, partial [Heterosigma akashiwo]
AAREAYEQGLAANSANTACKNGLERIKAQQRFQRAAVGSGSGEGGAGTQKLLAPAAEKLPGSLTTKVPASSTNR